MLTKKLSKLYRFKLTSGQWFHQSYQNLIEWHDYSCTHDAMAGQREQGRPDSGIARTISIGEPFFMLEAKQYKEIIALKVLTPNSSGWIEFRLNVLYNWIEPCL